MPLFFSIYLRNLTPEQRTELKKWILSDADAAMKIAWRITVGGPRNNLPVSTA